uniref:TH1 domain-containing protein n=1 Tax=Amphimedon queenslandica TaxID=400682 RepID=A0A1X7TPY3_AMPQE
MISRNQGDSENMVMFSDVVVKVSRRGRLREWCMMITDGNLLADVSHISASLLPDNFFIIHAPADQDRLFISARKTEIVTSLRIAYFDMTKQELNISLQNSIDYKVDRDQVRRVEFTQGDITLLLILLIAKVDNS